MWNRILDLLWDLHGMNCREAIRLSSEGMERKLTIREKFLLVCHHRLCRWCRAYSRQIRTMRKWARTLGTRGPSLSRAAAERMKEKLREIQGKH